MNTARLRELLELAAAKKSRDLARLEALLAQDRALETEIAHIASTPGRDMAAGAANTPLTQQGLRLAWADQRITRTRQRRAQLAPQITAARDDARQSLGKHQALEHLADMAGQKETSARNARAEREAMPARPQDQPGVSTG